MPIRPVRSSPSNPPQRLRSNTPALSKRRKELLSRRRRRGFFGGVERLEDRSMMAISLTSGGTYTQDFNTLATTGTANTALPADWSFIENGTSANTTYAADDGNSNAGNTFSYGTGTNTDRAFGSVQSGNNTPTIGATFINNTGAPLTSLNISYFGEQWRLGAVHAANDRLDFQYSLDATSVLTGTWVDVDGLDFIAPINSGSVGALVGNNAANRASISGTISGPSFNVPNGGTFWIRWNNFDASGSDDGLAVDDFSVTAPAVPVAPTFDITNQTTTNFTPVSYNFTVADDLPSGVSFSVVANDNTTLVPNANVVFSGTGTNRTVTITPAGTLNNANSRGTANITVRATDAVGGLFSEDSFAVTVNGAAMLLLGKGANGSPLTISGKPGDLVQIPIRLVTNNVSGTLGIDMAVLYDTTYLQLLPTAPPGPDPGPVSGTFGYTATGNSDDPGKLSITFARTGILGTGVNQPIAFINAIIKATAPVGTTPINMVKSAVINGATKTTQINEGLIVLGPEPTSASNDTLTDGVVTVTAGSNVAPTHTFNSNPFLGFEDTNVKLYDENDPTGNPQIVVVDGSAGNNFITTTLSVTSSAIGKFVPGSTASNAAVTLSNNDATITITGLEDQVNLIFSALEFAPALDRNNTDGTLTVTVQTNDTITTTTDTFTIDLTPINDKPSFTVTGNQSITNNGTAQTVNGFVNSTVFGPVSPGSETTQTTLSFNRTSANSALFSVQPTISATGVLQYTPALGQTGTTTVSFTMRDSGGTANGGVDTSNPVSFTITLTAPAGNAAPVNSFPVGPISGTEDVAVNFNPGNLISVTDSDSPSITTIISVPAGVGTFAATANGSSVTPSGSGTASVTFTGAPGQVSLALQSLIFTPALNRNNTDGTTTVTVNSNDGAGGVDTDTFNISLTPVNDQPSFTVGTVPSTLNNAGPQTLNGFATINRGAPNESAQTVTFNRTSGTSALFSSQPVIDANGNLTFTPAVGQSGTVTVTFTATDNGGTSPGVDTSAPVSFDITITAPANQAPVNSFPVGPVSGTEDIAVNLSGANLIQVTDADSASITTVVSVPAGVGTFAANANGGTVTPTGVGTNSISFVGAPAQIRTALQTLVFTPALNRNNTIGTTTITIVSNDGAGGVDTDTFNISLTPVNDAPVFTIGANQSVAEDSPLQTVNPFLTAIGPGGGSDENTQTVSFSLTNDSNGLFSVQPSINSAGVLTYTPAANAVGTANVTVIANDSGGAASVGQTFTITLTAVNDAPVNSFPAGPISGTEDTSVSLNAGNLISVVDIDSPSVTTVVSVPAGVGTFTASANGGVAPTGSGTNSLTFTGTPAQINLALQTLVFTPALNRNNTDGTTTVSINSNDGSGGVDADSFNISLTPVNDQPSFTVGTVPSTLNNAGPQTLNGFATINRGAPNESAQTVTFNRTSGTSALFSSQPVIDANGNLTFTPAVGQSGTVTVTFTATDNGGTSPGVDTSAPVSFDITITAPANQAPVNSFPVGPVSGTEDIAVNLSGANLIQVTDADSASITTVVSVPAGVGTFAANANGGTVTPTGVGTNSISFVGAPAQIRTALQTLVFTPALNRNNTIGTTTITIVSNDGAGGVDTDTFNISLTPVNDAPIFTVGTNQTAAEDAALQTVNPFLTAIGPGGGSDETTQTVAFNVSNDNTTLFSTQPTITPAGVLSYQPAANANGSAIVTVTATDSAGATSAPQTFTITITAVNDAPVNSFPVGPISGTEDIAVNLNAANLIQVVDIDSGSITTVVSVPAGVGTFTASANGSTVTPTGSGTNSVTFTGAPGQISQALQTLVFTPALNRNNTIGTTTVTINSNDGAGGVDTDTFNISLTPVNDAPVFTVGGNQTAAEDAALQTVNPFLTAIGPGGGSDETTQTVAFNVSNDNTTLFSTQPTITPAGVLTYQPATNANGSAIVTVTATDSAGATSAPQTFTITITAVNDAPSFVAGANPTILEDAGPQSISNFATGFSPGPANEASQQVLNYLVTGVTPSFFSSAPTVSPTGTLQYTVAPNVFGSGSFQLAVVDDGPTGGANVNTSTPVTVTITVTAVNDAPTFTMGGNQTAAYNSPLQLASTFATVTGVGPLESGQTVNFNVSNNNNSLFAVQPSIAQDGTLSYRPAANTSGTALVTVTLSDNAGTANGGIDTSPPQTFIITIGAPPANVPPTINPISPNPLNINEDAGLQTINLSGITAGGSETQNLTVTANSNNPALTGTITVVYTPNNPTGTITFTPTADANGTAVITVTVTDAGLDNLPGGGDDASTPITFTVNVAAVNDTPSFVVGANQTVAEDAGSQSVTNFATLISRGGGADESTQVLTFNVSNNNAGLFLTAPSISPTGTLTYQSNPNAVGTATVTVSLSDNGGGANTSPSQTFTITVTAVNDAPIFTVGSNQTSNEDAGLQTVNGFVTGIGPGGGSDESAQTVSFNVSNNNNPLFSTQPTISPAGVLTYQASSNLSGTATVTVTATDSAGATSGSQTFTITILAVNDAPVFTVGGNQTVNEDAGLQTVNGFVTGIGPGGGPDESAQTVSFNVSNSNGALFLTAPSITPAGTLTYQSLPNANGTATVTVTATDSGGATSGSQTFTITITAVNDVPVFTLGGTQTAAEDAPLQTVNGFVTGIGPGGGPDEAAQTISFNVSNNNNPLFSTQPSISPAGVLTYQPAADANGTATVTVTATDSAGATTTSQTFTINITAVNDAPTITVAANPTVLEDAVPQSVANFVTGFSPGPANESGQAILNYTVTNISNASLFLTAPAVNNAGTLTYALNPNANGSTTFELRAVDNGGTPGTDTSAPTIVTITVTPVNDVPVLTVGPNQTVAYNAPAQTVNGWATGISAGASNENGQALTFTVTNNTNTGLFSVQPTVSATGVLQYTPAANTAGTATITLQLSDNGGVTNGGVDTSATQTFTITVSPAPVNSPPTINPLTPNPLNIQEDASLQTIGFSGVTSGTETQAITVGVSSNNAALTGPINLTYTPNNPTGSFSFTPVANANGTATITVTVTDAGLDNIPGNSDDGSTTTTLTVNVAAVNDTPTFTKGANQTVNEDAGPQTVNPWATGVSRGGGADEASQTLTFNVTGNTNPGLFSALSISPTGVLTYTPAPNANGVASITVTLSDDGGGANTTTAQTFTITVNPVNDAPVFTLAGNQSVNEDAGGQSVPNFVTGVGPGGGPDEAGQTVTFGISNNSNAPLFSSQPTISATGTLTYTPAANASGVATITVTATDNLGATSAPQTFTITVNDVNDPPTFTGGFSQSVTEDSGPATYANWVSSISPGPANEASQTVAFNVTANSNPTLFSAGPSVSPTGTLTFTPAPNANGSATVSVQLQDSAGGLSSVLTFTITVFAINDSPFFTVGPNQTVNEDAGPQTVTPWATGISAGAPDEAGQTLTFNVIGNTNGGLFSSPPQISSNGTLTYTPAANASGTATITINLADNGGGATTSPSQTFTITVNPVNDAPTFSRGADLTVNEDAGPQSLTWATAISAGPADENGQTTSFAITGNSNPSLFSAGPTLSNSGVLTYTPAANTFGSSNITVVLSDSGGASGAPVTFTITVNPVNDAPSFAIGPNQTIAFGSGAQTVASFTSLISAGPANEAGQTVQFNIVGNSNPGLFTVAPAISPTGTLTYTPAAAASGSSTITVTISDNGGTANGGVNTSGTQTFSITITAQPINAAPTINAIANININEDAGLQTVNLSGITAGGAESQALTVSASSSDPNIVPVVAYTSPNATGTLTFTPPADYFTSVPATVTVTVRDAGLNGTPNDSDDGITTRTFTVTINAVNDTPSYTIGANQTVNEDAGPQTVSGFATAISAGPANEASQTLTFNIVGNTNTGLFSALPSISPTGVLTYTPAPNANGVATISVTLSDNGGGTNTSGTQTFTITVNPINDAPTFTPGTNLTINEDAGPQSLAWASAVSVGPANESSQTASFAITGNTNPTLFSVAPTISPSGILTYTPTANAFGSSSITVVLSDSAGDSTAPVTFTITVNPVNDAPSFTVGPNQTIAFGSPAQTVTNFATSISAGPANESGQTVQFNIIGNSNPGLFSVAPAIAANGTLTYTPNGAATGTSTITVNISDDGGVSNGGVNTSANQTFTITITAQPINAPPTLNSLGSLSINEDAGLQTVNLSGITAGGSESQALTVTASSSDPNIVPAVAYTSPNATGTLTFTPPADYFTASPATITVTVRDAGLNGTPNDGDDGIITRTFTVTINAINDTPSFTVGANQTVNEDAGPQTVNPWATAISAGPANESSQVLTFNVIGNSNPGLFSAGPTISPAGVLTYTPAANANGSATISLTLSDNGGGASTTATQTFTITVNPVNDAPSFVAGPTQNVNEDAGLQTVANWAQAISAGPANESGQTVSFTISGNSNPGLFSVAPSVSSNGTLTYTPAANANGTATITLNIADNGGTANGGVDVSTSQTFVINVNAVNDTPSFTAGPNQTVNEDAGLQTVTPWATAISAGPANEAGQTLTFNIVGNSNPSLFSVTPAISPTGVLTYTPAPNAFGMSTISVTLSDNGGGANTTSTQTFTITVNPVNDAPSFTVGPNQSVGEDAGPQTVGNWAQAISAGPANENTQTVSFVITGNTNPSLFSVLPSVAPNGTLTYTPAANASGTATITLNIADNGGTANGGIDAGPSQTFTITVNDVNDTPSFTAGPSQTVNEDAGPQTVAPWATAISAGPPNEAGQTLTFNIATNSNPSLFSVQPTIAANGTLTYTPAPNAFGSATIAVTLSDNGVPASTSAQQTFTITVNPVNDAPTFVLGPNQVVNEDATTQNVSGFASAISAGPANEAGQSVAFTITGNTNAALFSSQPTISPSGTLSYTPAPNANGSATITVTLTDNGGTASGGVNSSTQTFTITVNPVNDAPTFTPGANQNVNEDAGPQTVSSWASAVSPGPANESGQTVSFLITGNSNPSLFSAGPAISPTGALTYTPAPDANGSATISVQLNDSAGGASSVATFTISIAPVNDAPTFTAGPNQVVNEDAGAQSVSGWATGVSVGPANESTQTLTFNITGNSNPALFSAAPAVSPTGVLTYTPAPNASGTATITLVAVDNGGTANGGVNTSAPQTFTITVNPINDAPDAADSTFTTPLNTPLNATVVVNDPDGPTLTYSLGTLPVLGTVTSFNTSTGAFTYTPNPGATGLDTFTFSVTDGTSTDSATVRISIQGSTPIVTATGGNIEVLGTTAEDTIIISKGPTGQALVRTSSGSFNASANYPLAANGTITISSGDGRDYIVINGLTNPVSIDAGAGNDYISSGTGDDFIVGGSGDDQINASGGNNVVWGDELGQQDLAVGGNDMLSSLAGNDIMYGGGGNDQLYPGDGNDYAHAGAGNDTVSASGGNDRIYGGAGNDVLGGDGGDDVISGGSGNDYLIGGDGNDVLIGGAGGGGDSINGNAGSDLMIAGDTTNSQSSTVNDANDTALMALLSNWNSTHGAGIASGITTGDDGAADTLSGDVGDDDFYALPNDVLNDFNGLNMGTDRRFP